MTEPAFRCRVYGYPVAQGRPRAFVPKGWTRPVMHDPTESRDWKRTVQSQILNVKPPAPLDGPLSVRLVFVLMKPPSVNPKRRPWPSVKPDVENMSKAVCDAICGMVYRDDSQIVELYLRKEYGEQPGVDIEVRHIETPAAFVPTSTIQGGLFAKEGGA